LSRSSPEEAVEAAATVAVVVTVEAVVVTVEAEAGMLAEVVESEAAAVVVAGSEVARPCVPRPCVLPRRP
jgi:hypothetical protein